MARGTATVKVVTNWGRAVKLQLLTVAMPDWAKMTNMMLGIGTSADAAVGDTALQSLITDSGLAQATVVPTIAGTTVTWTHTWTATAAKTISELGITTVTGTNPYIHITLGSSNDVVLAPGDSFQVTITDQE